MPKVQRMKIRCFGVSFGWKLRKDSVKFARIHPRKYPPINVSQAGYQLFNQICSNLNDRHLCRKSSQIYQNDLRNLDHANHHVADFSMEKSAVAKWHCSHQPQAAGTRDVSENLLRSTCRKVPVFTEDVFLVPSMSVGYIYTYIYNITSHYIRLHTYINTCIYTVIIIHKSFLWPKKHIKCHFWAFLPHFQENQRISRDLPRLSCPCLAGLDDLTTPRGKHPKTPSLTRRWKSNPPSEKLKEKTRPTSSNLLRARHPPIRMARRQSESIHTYRFPTNTPISGSRDIISQHHWTSPITALKATHNLPSKKRERSGPVAHRWDWNHGLSPFFAKKNLFKGLQLDTAIKIFPTGYLSSLNACEM